MILPLALGAAALVFLGKGVADNHRHALTKRFSRTTLIASSEDGVYDTVEMPNTTKSLTHILNAVFQHKTCVYTTRDGSKVTFDGPSKKEFWAKRGFELYLSPENIKLMPGKK